MAIIFTRELVLEKVLYGISGFETSTGYGIATFLVTGIGSQRKFATEIGILKRKPDVLLIILPDAVNLKCLYFVMQISQNFFEISFTLFHGIRKLKRTPTTF